MILEIDIMRLLSCYFLTWLDAKYNLQIPQTQNQDGLELKSRVFITL